MDKREDMPERSYRPRKSALLRPWDAACAMLSAIVRAWRAITSFEVVELVAVCLQEPG